MARGIFFFVGPVLLVFAMVFEWIMGNFFPMMVMGLFAVFWLSFGVLQLPTLQLGAAYASLGRPYGSLVPRIQLDRRASTLIVWGFALFTFFIFTTKINTRLRPDLPPRERGFVGSGRSVLQGRPTAEYDTAGKMQKVGLAEKHESSKTLMTVFIVQAGEHCYSWSQR